MPHKKKPVTIAMVDDHILLRDALASVIDAFEDCKVIILAAHGKELLEKMQPGNQPDLVILDLNMPELDGYETSRVLRLKYPEVFTLVLTMYDSEVALIRLLQMGVRGFLKKDIHPGELRYAIQSVMQTGYYYTHTSTARIANFLKNTGAKNPIPNNAILTENELLFLKLASTDLTYKEIALEMGISPRTVDNYRDALFTKLNVKSRVGLAMYAIKSGIVTLRY
jgi:two-component system invasion response regulator UvrY